ncbi:MAG: (Fe-S)-binding protein [Candidatus Bathyarchaeia archaeon]
MSESMAIFKDLNFNVCMQCGKCSGSCPLFSKSPLNPRKLMLEMAYLTSSLITYPPLNVRERSDVWDCTTCSTCSFYCPRDAKPLDVIIGLRAFLLEQGLVPRTLADVLEAVYKYGNPWGLSPSKRDMWARDLKVKYASSEKENDLLYFVGCAASYDNRAQEVAKAIVKNLNLLGIDFSILGNEEKCCGNEIYSLGEKGLFEDLERHNLKLFEQYNVHEIVVTSPHCYHAFKNRYTLKRGLQVKHYTQYFAELIDSQKLKLSKKIEKVVTYHDPCFLGKHNNVYDEPRKIIEGIPGVTFVEFSKSKKRSVCCEGGGGRMWYDVPGGRLAEKRVKEAVDLGVEIIAVACPFCLLTFEDAIKTTGNEGKIEVKDIMELVNEALR